MIQIKISGIERLKTLGSRVEQAFRSSASLAAARDDIQRALVAQANREFASQRGPDGQQWQKLSPSYEKRKRKLVGAKPILVRTGAMQRSLQSPLVRLTNFGRDLTIQYTGEGSDLIALHDRGAGNLPVRRLVGIGRQAQEQIAAISFKRISESFFKGVKGK